MRVIQQKLGVGVAGLWLLAMLLLLSLGLWVVVVLVFHNRPALLALAATAYVFGLRHALDADHIAAIDGVTRRLLAAEKKRVSVGLIFSLGHSTVVVGLSLLLIVSVNRVSHSLSGLLQFGTVFGGVVSASLLLALGGANFWGLYHSRRQRKERRDWENSKASHDAQTGVSGGLLTPLLGPVLKLVDTNWKMFVVGFLFGLGFDTASEVVILVISAGTASQGMPFWYCLLFPLLFAAGMTLVDFLDNILILSACNWALTTPRGARYYNAAMTLTTIVMAIGIGIVEIWGILSPQIGSWVAIINSHFVFVGAGFVVITATVWLGSWLVYRLRAKAIPAS
ncbi:MAG: HoxN/HupN/NixA family nickel/cobalt transporter [Phycisphaerae bacterium]|nr:HoxN/HupN/NixA family nickel/cobalt transporter [Phycisphaerae bacterium]